MTTIKLNNALKTSLPSFGMGRLIGLLFFFLIQITFAQPDNNKQVYDLNDPRNPDCPCHKYQKMADDEFKKLQKKNKSNHPEQIADKENQKMVVDEFKKNQHKNNPNQPEEIADKEKKQDINVQKIQAKDVERPLGLSNSDYSKKQKQKKITGMIHKFINFFTLKPHKTRKVKPIYSICFKW